MRSMQPGMLKVSVLLTNRTRRCAFSDACCTAVLRMLLTLAHPFAARLMIAVAVASAPWYCIVKGEDCVLQRQVIDASAATARLPIKAGH
jgi:hypothetical protein